MTDSQFINFANKSPFNREITCRLLIDILSSEVDKLLDLELNAGVPQTLTSSFMFAIAGMCVEYRDQFGHTEFLSQFEQAKAERPLFYVLDLILGPVVRTKD